MVSDKIINCVKWIYAIEYWFFFFFCFRVKELTDNINAEVAIKEELTASIKAKDEEIEVRIVYPLSFLCKLSLILH